MGACYRGLIKNYWTTHIYGWVRQSLGVAMLKTAGFSNCRNALPSLNPDLCEGLVCRQSEDQIEKYIDEVFKCAQLSFPPGLTYCGYRRARPEEQLRELTKKRRQQRTFDIAESDLYHCIFTFDFNGEKEERYMLLPYFRRGGIIRLRSSSFVASPVLADSNFSIEPNRIYIPLTRSKLTFTSEPYCLLERNAQTVQTLGSWDRLHVTLVTSKVFNVSGNDASKRSCIIFHYLLAKYGLTKTLEKYYKLEVSDYVVGTEAEITLERYPTDKWIHFKSRGLRPKHAPKIQYSPTEVTFAVKADRVNMYTRIALASLFYLLDYDPTICTPLHFDNTVMWRRVLYRYIKATASDERKAIEEMDAHIASVDSYLDVIVKTRLRGDGFNYDDVYDMFADITIMYDEITVNSQPDSMVDKQLETTRFIMYDVVSGISNLLFELIKLKDERLNMNFIRQAFNQKFPSETIMKLKSGHGEITSLNSATDCLPYATTRKVVPQVKASVSRGAKAKKALEMTDPSYALHASQLYINTYLFITKGAPSSRESINHFLKLDDNYRIQLDVSELKFIDELERQMGK